MPYGDFIIMSPFKQSTKELSFIINRNTKAETIDLKIPIRVKNIINFHQQFIIYGWALDDTGLAVNIDLDKTEFRGCLNPVKAG